MPQVILHGEEVPVIGPPLRQIISPFGATFGTGEQKRSDLSLAKHFAFEEFSGGIGVERLEEDGQRDRYNDAAGVNAIRGTQLVLETLHTVSATIGAGATPEVGVIFGGDLYISADDNKVYKWTGSAWSEVDDPSALVTDFVVFMDNDGTDYLFAAYGTGYMHTSDGATWNDEAQDVDYWAIFDNELIGLDGTAGAIIHDTTPASSQSWTTKISRVQGTARGITVFRDQDGAPSLWYSTSVGLFQVDWSGAKSYLIYDYRSTPYANNGKSMREFNGNLIFPVGQEVLAISPQGNVVSLGPDRDDGLTNTDHGNYVQRILPLQNFLLILNRSSTKAAVFLWTGSAWQPHTTGLTASNFMIHETDTGTNQPRLWVGNGTSAPIYQALNDQSERKFPFSGQTFESSGTWTSYWTSFGFPEIPKLVFSIEIIGRDLTAAEQVKVEMQTDDESASTEWEVVGVTTGRGRKHTLELGGGQGKQINNLRLRLTLSRGASPTSATPIVEAVVMKFLVVPEVRWGWTFVVPIAEDGWKTGEQWAEWLEEIAEEARKGNLEFYPTGRRDGSRFWVQLTHGPFSIAAYEDLGGVGQTVGGTAQLTVAVPV